MCKILNAKLLNLWKLDCDSLEEDVNNSANMSDLKILQKPVTEYNTKCNAETHWLAISTLIIREIRQ